MGEETDGLYTGFDKDIDSVQVNSPGKDTSVAEAKPVGLAIAGAGGVASSKPSATAVVGPGVYWGDMKKIKIIHFVFIYVLMNNDI